MTTLVASGKSALQTKDELKKNVVFGDYPDTDSDDENSEAEWSIDYSQIVFRSDAMDNGARFREQQKVTRYDRAELWSQYSCMNSVYAVENLRDWIRDTTHTDWNLNSRLAVTRINQLETQHRRKVGYTTPKTERPADGIAYKGGHSKAREAIWKGGESGMKMFHDSKKHLKTNPFWKVPERNPRRKVTAIPPMGSDPRLLRDWVLTWAYNLRKAHPNSTKRFAVIGNGAAEVVYNAWAKAPSAFLHQEVVKAHLWFDDMNGTNFRSGPPPLKIWHLIENSPQVKSANKIVVCGMEVHSVAELEALSTLFRRDKPVFRAARDYLSGLKVDLPKLEHSLSLIGVKKQGAEDGLSEGITSYIASVILMTSDMGESVTGIKLLEPPDLSVLLPQALKLGALYHLLSEAVTWGQVCSALLLYAVDTPLAKQCANLAARYVGEIFSLQGEEDSEGDKGFFNWSLARLDSFPREILDSLCALFGTLLSVGILPSEKMGFVSACCGDLGREVFGVMRRTGMKRLGEALVEVLVRFMGKVNMCIREGSLAPLLNPSNSPVSVIRDSEQILTHMGELVDCGNVTEQSEARLKELVRKGVLPHYITTHLTPCEFGNLLVDLVQRIEKLNVLYHGTSMGVDLSRMRTRLYTALAQESGANGMSARRIQPLGLLLFGGPSVGKTGFARDTTDAIGVAENYDIDDASYYEWQPNDNFQSNFSHRQWAVFLQDIDTTVAQPTAGVMNHVEVSMKLIDNKPFPVEQAAVDLKGKVCARPLLVVQTTNFPFGRVKGFTMKPDAFYRRYPIVVELKPKKEYSMGEGKVLDGEKAAMSPDMEVHDIIVYEVDPSKFDDTSGRPPYKPGRLMSRAEFLVYFHKAYKKHMASQRRYINATHGRIACTECFSLKQCIHRRWDEETGKDYSTVLTVYGAHKKQGQLGTVVVGSALALTGMRLYRMYHNERFKHWVENVMVLPERMLTTLDDVRHMVNRARTLDEKMTQFLQWIPSKHVVALAAVLTAGVIGLGRWQSRFRSQARVDNAVEGLPVNSWKRAPQEYAPGLPDRGITYTQDEVFSGVTACLVRVRGKVACYGAAWGHNVVSTVAHAIPDDGELFKIEYNGVTYEVKAQRGFNVIQLGFETVLVKVPSLICHKSIVRALWTVDESVSAFDELVLITPNRTVQCEKPKLSRMPHMGYVVRHGTETFDGECGSIYIARIGKGWRIVAHHAVAWESSALFRASYGGPVLNYLDMQSGAMALSTVLQGVTIPVRQVSHLGAKQPFEKYPEKSEAWTAVSQLGCQIVPLGTANPNVHGSTMKASFAPTLHADEFRDLEKLYCGMSPYWMAPVMKGEMRDGLWVSPYTPMFKYINRKDVDYDFMWLALVDYLGGFLHCDTSGYRAISPEEVIKGIPNSHIWGVDMTTSVGTPFNRKKKEFIVVKENMAFLDPRLSLLLDEYREVGSLDIPSPVALVTLKDEVVSEKKVRELGTRTFECMSVAHNIWASEVGAPVNSFLRDNVQVSECYVGVNMTSPEATKLVERLRAADPSLKRLIAKDVEKIDKSASGSNLDMVALCYFFLARLLGIDSVHAYKSIQAVRNTTYVVKNDFFVIGTENPSGNSDTVQINSLMVSLCERIVYYRMKFPNGLPDELRKSLLTLAKTFWLDPVMAVRDCPSKEMDFRVNVALGTYGDDSLAGVSVRAGFYDVGKVQSLYWECFRWKVTDEFKRVDISWCDISEVAFLKRNFVWDAELGYYLTPLSVKTIVKMLVARTRSTLGDIDHSCTLLTDAMREAAYHGERFYRMLYSRVMRVAVEYGYIGNRYFRVPLYHQVREEMRRGTFQTWGPVAVDPGMNAALSDDAGSLSTFGLTQTLNNNKTTGI